MKPIAKKQVIHSIAGYRTGQTGTFEGADQAGLTSVEGRILRIEETPAGGIDLVIGLADRDAVKRIQVKGNAINLLRAA